MSSSPQGQLTLYFEPGLPDRFLWNTGAPSCLYTEAGHRAADRHAQGAGGKALDAKGRALVQMEPHHKQSIRIASRADSIKTQLIKRGASR